MELTQEYFDQQLGLLASHLDNLPTKADLGSLEARVDELPTKSDFAALKQTVNDIQETVTRIDTRSDEEIRAAYKDIAQIKKHLGLKPAL